MNKTDEISEIVRQCYWEKDINCARTTLTALSKLHNLPLEDAVYQAAIGMHGAGGFRAQCGLVEGALMFMGIAGSRAGKTGSEIADGCRAFAGEFQKEFGSLSCFDLRPGGFRADDPPHFCEQLTVRAIIFSDNSIRRILKI